MELEIVSEAVLQERLHPSDLGSARKKHEEVSASARLLAAKHRPNAMRDPFLESSLVWPIEVEQRHGVRSADRLHERCVSEELLKRRRRESRRHHDDPEVRTNGFLDL